MSARDRMKLNMARTSEEVKRVAALPKEDTTSKAAAEAARARQTNNHPYRS